MTRGARNILLFAITVFSSMLLSSPASAAPAARTDAAAYRDNSTVASSLNGSSRASHQHTARTLADTCGIHPDAARLFAGIADGMMGSLNAGSRQVCVQGNATAVTVSP